MGSSRDRLLGRLGELAELARESGAHSPGPWTVGMSPFHIADANGMEVTADRSIFGPTRRFIAAHSPSLAGAVWEGLSEEVRRHHATERVHPNPGGPAWSEEVCFDCGGAWDPACDFILRWASRLGVGADDGGTEDSRPVEETESQVAPGQPASGERDASSTGPGEARYGQCDDTCTTDCGHCKGDGPPAPRLPLDAGLRRVPGALPPSLAASSGETARDPWRMAEWETLPDTCLIAGCEGDEIDQRGPVFLRDGSMHKACVDHWTGVYRVLGEQATWEQDAMAASPPALAASAAANAESPAPAQTTGRASGDE